jgi:aldose 1-epimerase
MKVEPIYSILPNREHFKKNIDGQATDLIAIAHEGIIVYLTNYGARVISIFVEDDNSNVVDVVVGPGTLDGFLKEGGFYYGATVGRYANRIAKGKFTLNSTTYNLDINNGNNHLHGGVVGLQCKVWHIEKVDNHKVLFSYTAKDGEDGYPGNVTYKVTYEVTKAQAIEISYEAITDADTVINVTNHAFFNLNGYDAGSIENHNLQIFADAITEVDAELIPTGKMVNVANTPFDFNTTKRIGKDISANDEQLKYGNGYDHNFVVNSQADHSCGLVAIAEGDTTGIKLHVYTTEPGMQLYTGNFMNGQHFIKHNSVDNFRSAFCLETQHFPDSPNHAHFPSTILKKGQTFLSKTIYAFSK